MLDTTKHHCGIETNTKVKIDDRYIIIDNLNQLKNIPDNVELCIIETDFNKSDIDKLKKFKNNKNLEIWISSENLSRENILLSNKLGIKTVINYPVNEKTIEEFFIKKNTTMFIEAAKPNENDIDIQNCKIMIVDDNPMNIELLEEILSSHKFKLTSFLKSKDAYKAALAEKFDLFLLDVMMPELSGFELARKIKEIKHNQDAPIVFISALADSRSKIKGYELGSFAYIEKPFDINVIWSQITNILKAATQRNLLSQDKEDFLAMVTHDLKTPIRAGINALNLLLDENLGELDESQQELIEDILLSTKFMRDMVDNILCKNQIEIGSMQLSKQVNSVEELVKTCLDLTKYLLLSKKQQIKYICETKNLILPFDFLEMKRALHNLISNASQYSPEGSDIIIKVFQTNKKMGISVTDFGPGIAFKNQEDIFLRYMTYAKKHKTVGAGLGLYVTKKIVDAHGGEIKVKSKVGEGSTFTILLPMYTKD